MKFLDWEFFDSTILSKYFSITNQGPLFGPISSFEVERNKDLQLILKTKSASDSRANREPPRANLVKRLDGEVHFQHNHNDSIVIAIGISPSGSTITHSGTPPSSGIRVETASINAIKWKRTNTKKVSYIIDWIENLSGPYLWPHSDEIKETTNKERRFIAGDEELIIKTSDSSDGFNRSCAQITIGDLKVIIGKSSVKKEHISNPGFILYIGEPNEDTRKKNSSMPLLLTWRLFNSPRLGLF